MRSSPVTNSLHACPIWFESAQIERMECDVLLACASMSIALTRGREVTIYGTIYAR